MRSPRTRSSLGVLRGIERFEGRASLRTWLLTILVNRARSTGAREARTVPVGGGEPAVDPSRFDAGGAWSDLPGHWTERVEERIGAAVLREEILSTLSAMPARQRAVVMLRDVDGPRSDEVCDVLELTPANDLEGTLSRRDRRRMDHHLAGCDHCSEYLAQMRETLRLTGRLVPEDLTRAMEGEFADLYRRLCASE